MRYNNEECEVLTTNSENIFFANEKFFRNLKPRKVYSDRITVKECIEGKEWKPLTAVDRRKSILVWSRRNDA